LDFRREFYARFDIRGSFNRGEEQA
jgi:hypothetical protein